MELIARDPRIDWPDGITVQNNDVYVVAGQWERLAGFHHGKDLQEPNYLLSTYLFKYTSCDYS